MANNIGTVTTNYEMAGVDWSSGSYAGTVVEDPNTRTYGTVFRYPDTNTALVTNTYQALSYVAIDEAGTKYSTKEDGYVGSMITIDGGAYSIWPTFHAAVNLYKGSTALTSDSWSIDGTGKETESGQAGALLAVSSNNYAYYSYPVGTTNSFTVNWNGTPYLTTTNHPTAGYYLNNSNWLVGPSFNNTNLPTLFRGPSGSTQTLPFTPIGINDRSYTDTNGNIYPDYQILTTNSVAESATDVNGNPIGFYGSKATSFIDNDIPKGWTNTIATSLNNAGVIVGSSIDGVDPHVTDLCITD